ncbi:hypothetical protein BXZ70DRAFT_939102 [Cristinia sonorae]|uniref:Uncharacterized protein n=1 Tax=Cristinia sonorae TaxID=1940300 RepID=A0A8K0XPI8_9AGAR|nr:hypothetical protein BXZ70DRAFT_939102 [Cristinia sonorae]
MHIKHAVFESFSLNCRLRQLGMQVNHSPASDEQSHSQSLLFYSPPSQHQSDGYFNCLGISNVDISSFAPTIQITHQPDFPSLNVAQGDLEECRGLWSLPYLQETHSVSPAGSSSTLGASPYASSDALSPETPSRTFSPRTYAAPSTSTELFGFPQVGHPPQTPYIASAVDDFPWAIPKVHFSRTSELQPTLLISTENCSPHLSASGSPYGTNSPFPSPMLSPHFEGLISSAHSSPQPLETPLTAEEQTEGSPRSESTRKVIFRRDGKPGIPLVEALSKTVPVDDAGELVDCFLGCRKISLKIRWPGYIEHGCYINVKNGTALTRAELLTRIALRVDKWMKHESRGDRLPERSKSDHVQPFIIGSPRLRETVMIDSIARKGDNTWIFIPRLQSSQIASTLVIEGV